VPGVAAPVSVDSADRGKARVRFAEVPQLLHGDDPRWVPPLLAWERYRLDQHRNPYFEEAEVGLLLARRAHRPVGRIAVHLPEPGAEGRFGFWSVAEDREVAVALVEAAGTWLDERGCTSMTGPWSFRPDDEPGVLVAGQDAGGTTGRPWQPRHEADLLETTGFESIEETSTWRLRTSEVGPEAPPAGDDVERPRHAGSYADGRLVLDRIAAVPDLSGALRAAGIRGAWGLAKRARLAEWEGCTVVRCTGVAAVEVPAIVAAAGRAGYSWVVAPWSPDPEAAPETVHRRYRLRW
jgi:hypothetical protein